MRVVRGDYETVRVGSRVRLLDKDGEEEFFVVPPEDADAARQRVSMDSPVGRALLGRAVGESVSVRVPGGLRAVTIVSAVPVQSGRF